MLVYTKAKISIQIDDEPMASAGGEGTVYYVKSIGQYANSCVKIYHVPKRTLQRRNKIEFMILHKPNDLIYKKFVICWPKEVIFDIKGNFLGFLMPLAFRESISLYELTRINTPKEPQKHLNKFDRSTQSGIEKRLSICVNIAIAINSIHMTEKYVIVDYKPQNILITNDGRISIIDVDSFQIANNGVVLFHSDVTTPEYAPPESKTINPSKDYVSESWDRFSLAVSFYEILFGIHPYAATCSGKYKEISTIGEKIQKGLFVHGASESELSVIPQIHNNFQNIPRSLRKLFIKTFKKGHNYPNKRPTAKQWGETIFSELKTKKGIKAYKIGEPKNNVIINKPFLTNTSNGINIPNHQKINKIIPIRNKSKLWIGIIGILLLLIFSIYIFKQKNENQIPTIHYSINQTGYVNSKTYARIRKGPSVNYEIISKKYRGDSVYVLDQDVSTGWYKVIYDTKGNIGYISNELISFKLIKKREKRIQSNKKETFQSDTSVQNIQIQTEVREDKQIEKSNQTLSNPPIKEETQNPN